MHRFGILLLVGLVTSNDLAVGPKNVGQKIFDEKKEASPAIWRQVHNITIDATNDEIINSINIVDLRPEKDGEANIIDGGIGHQNVTIELKSPAVFRGYDFQIQAFSVPISEFKGVLPEHKVSSTPSTQHVETSNQHVPILTTKDLENNTRLVRKSGDNEPTSTPGTDENTSTSEPASSTLNNVQTPKIYETSATVTESKTINEVSITPKTQGKLNNDGLQYVPKVLTKDITLSTDEVESSSVLSTTEDDAQMIDINGQNPTIGNHYPPITHEEQGKRGGRDTYTSQETTVTPSHEQSTPKLSHPNPTVQTAKPVTTKHDNPITTASPKGKHVTKTVGAVNENNENFHYQQELEGLQEKQNLTMKPLPYMNQ